MSFIAKTSAASPLAIAVGLCVLFAAGCNAADIFRRGSMQQTGDSASQNRERVAEPLKAGGVVSTREAMRAILEDLETVLPHSLDRNDYGSPANAAAINTSLGRLVASAGALDLHAPSRGGSFGLHADSLSTQARQAQESYATGDFEHSRFYVRRLTETCASCHARLPVYLDAPDVSNDLARSIIDADLSLTRRARLLTTLRRFQDAAHSYEKAFLSTEFSPAELDLEGDLVEYLTLTVRVLRTPDRTIEGLSALQRRSDVPQYLQKVLETWRSSLEEVQTIANDAASLVSAEAALEAAATVRTFPGDRSSAVYEIYAAGHLYRLIESGELADEELAEVFHKLGVTQTWLQKAAYIPEAEDYLARAIRLAPGSRTAAEAYSLLEQIVLLGYSGSGGTQIPAAVLDDLRAMEATAHPTPDLPEMRP